MSKRVKFPEFELVGPKCRDKNCKGILVITMNLKFQDVHYVCSECKKRFEKEKYPSCKTCKWYPPNHIECDSCSEPDHCNHTQKEKDE